MRYAPLALAALLAASACSTSPVGRAPAFSPIDSSPEHYAMSTPVLPEQPATTQGRASLWSAGQQSLLGDQRAGKRGDIMTVVIDIDEKAQIKNSSSRSRSGSENMGVSSLFGLPERLPAGIGVDPAVGLESKSQAEGEGDVRRNEKLTLRVAATVVDVLPNRLLKNSDIATLVPNRVVFWALSSS